MKPWNASADCPKTRSYRIYFDLTHARIPVQHVITSEQATAADILFCFYNVFVGGWLRYFFLYTTEMSRILNVCSSYVSMFVSLKILMTQSLNLAHVL